MEYLHVNKDFADRFNKSRSIDGSFCIEFTELKDGTFILPIEVKEILPEYFNSVDLEVKQKEESKVFTSITDEKILSSKNGVKRPSTKLTPL